MSNSQKIRMVYQKIIAHNSSLWNGADLILPDKDISITPPSGGKIVYLGIQGLPGVRFTLNQLQEQSENILMIGATGVFELDLQNTDAYISSINFKKENLLNLNGPKGYLIIDYIVETQGE